MALKWNSESGSYEFAPEEPSLMGENPYTETIPAIPKKQPVQSEEAFVKQESDAMDKAAKAAELAGTVSANPYIAGAGLGLQALSMIQQGKQQERQMAYQNALAKYNARQRQLENLAEIGRSLRV